MIGEAPSKGLSVFASATGEALHPAGLPQGGGLDACPDFYPPPVVNAASSDISDPNEWVYLAGYGITDGAVNGVAG